MDFTQKSCREFVEVLASNAPVPGGGGAAALVGAIGTALGNMVGSLTVGKKKYADVEAEIIALKAKCDGLQTELLDQVPADAVGFEPLAKAYGIPKADPNRDKILEDARKDADVEQQRRRQQTQEEIADLVMTATAKLVASKQNAEADRALYDQFIAKTGEKA